MLVDTHCHLDASEFDDDRADIAVRAQDAGVARIVVPAVEAANFTIVQALAAEFPWCRYALGIHPLFIARAKEEDIDALKQQLEQRLPVAIGEIGLDLFIPNPDIERQQVFFVAQLKLAHDFDLPVILHVRKSSDLILKHLRRIGVKGGIAHAFNGSFQQAERFMEMGFKLGFGGAMTYDRALHIRELARKLPLEAIVLETDAPDIAPEWLGHRGRNSPHELPAIARVLADLRGLPLAEVIAATGKNALEALPAIA